MSQCNHGNEINTNFLCGQENVWKMWGLHADWSYNQLTKICGLKHPVVVQVEAYVSCIPGITFATDYSSAHTFICFVYVHIVQI